jgi:hypothetical protein
VHNGRRAQPLLKGKEWIAAKQGFSVKSDKVIIATMFGVLLALYTAVVYSFMVAESGEARQAYLLLLAVPLALLVLRYPKMALFIIAILIYIMRWMYDSLFLLPREITYVPDILIVMMVISTLIRVVRRGERRPIVTLVMFLVVFGILSGLLNGIGLMEMIGGLRMAFHFVLLFVAAQYLGLTKGQSKSFFVLLLVIGLAQTPVTLYQFNVLKQYWDDAMGTFGIGQTPGIALYLLVLLSYLGARMIEKNRGRAFFLVTIVWMSVCPVVGEAKFYFLMLPFLLIFMFRSELFRRPGLLIFMLVTGTTLLVVGDRLASSAGGWYDNLRPLKLLERIPGYFQHDLETAQYGRYDRGYQLVSAVQLVSDSPRHILIGYGAGAATESQFAANSPSVSHFASRWGLISSSTMPALWLLIEYGYLGLGLIFYLLWMIYRRGKILRASEDVDMRVYGRMLQSIVMLYTIWMFYQSAWQSDAMAYIFWAPAGVLVGFSYQEEARQRASKRQAAVSAAAIGDAQPAVASV